MLVAIVVWGSRAPSEIMRKLLVAIVVWGGTVSGRDDKDAGCYSCLGGPAPKSDIEESIEH